MSKHERGPADAFNDGKVVRPTNSSRSFARGGGTMRHVLKQHEEAAPHHPAGGHGTQERLPDEDGDGRPGDLHY